MKALTWHGKRDVQVDNVPDPTIQEPTDARLAAITPDSVSKKLMNEAARTG